MHFSCWMMRILHVSMRFIFVHGETNLLIILYDWCKGVDQYRTFLSSFSQQQTNSFFYQSVWLQKQCFLLQQNSQPKQPHGIFGHSHWEKDSRPHCNRIVYRHNSKDGPKFPSIMYRGEGVDIFGAPPPLQVDNVPPHHPQIHVSRGRFNKWKRPLPVHLWPQLYRWKFCSKAHKHGGALNGQQRPQHQWLPILPLHRSHSVARWEARGVWASPRGFWCVACYGGRGLKVGDTKARG